MGIEWLKEITALLNAGGIRAGEAYPAGKQVELTGPVAAVGLRDLNYREQSGEFEVRVLSPGALGGWECQTAAAEVVSILENGGLSCRMEPMQHQAAMGCFEMLVIATRMLPKEDEGGNPVPAFSGLDVTVAGAAVAYVTEFTAEQDRNRRMIGTLNRIAPVGVTAGTGGWSIKLVQELPAGETLAAEPLEPFQLVLRESGMETVFSGCCWNRLKKRVNGDGIRAEWEGFALTREETADGEAEV